MGRSISIFRAWSRPKSIVKNLNFVGIKGSYTSFGSNQAQPRQTDISNILLKDFDVTIKNDKLSAQALPISNLKTSSSTESPIPHRAFSRWV